MPAPLSDWGAGKAPPRRGGASMPTARACSQARPLASGEGLHPGAACRHLPPRTGQGSRAAAREGSWATAPFLTVGCHHAPQHRGNGFQPSAPGRGGGPQRVTHSPTTRARAAFTTSKTYLFGGASSPVACQPSSAGWWLPARTVIVEQLDTAQAAAERAGTMKNGYSWGRFLLYGDPDVVEVIRKRL
jgi:hypothetical protein